MLIILRIETSKFATVPIQELVLLIAMVENIAYGHVRRDDSNSTVLC